MVLKYNDDESYYELTVNKFKIGNLILDVAEITLMVDSGTTFTHFPSSYVNKILAYLNNYCTSHKDRCGKIGETNFDEDTCLELK